MEVVKTPPCGSLHKVSFFFGTLFHWQQTYNYRHRLTTVLYKQRMATEALKNRGPNHAVCALALGVLSRTQPVETPLSLPWGAWRIFSVPLLIEKNHEAEADSSDSHDVSHQIPHINVLGVQGTQTHWLAWLKRCKEEGP
jgi:hypothetical protein